MNESFINYLSFSIGISALIALVRFKTIDRRFIPVALLLVTGFVNELISYYYVEVKDESNAVNYNIYTLAECLLLLWQFRLWRTIKKTQVFRILMIGFCGWWLAENFYYGSLSKMDSPFIIGYSLVILVLTAETIINMLFYEDARMWRNPKFIFCLSVLTFFSVSTIVEVFWMFHLNRIGEFKTRVYQVQNFANLIVNLLLVFAVLWIPRKPRYSLAW